MNDKVVDVKNEVILSLAHRMCFRYKHLEEDRYRFSDQTIIDFARRILSDLDGEPGLDNKDAELMAVVAYNSGYESGIRDGVRQAAEINGGEVDGKDPVWTHCAAYLYSLNAEIQRLNTSLSESINGTGDRSGLEKALNICRRVVHNKSMSLGRYEDEIAGMNECIEAIEAEIGG